MALGESFHMTGVMTQFISTWSYRKQGLLGTWVHSPEKKYRCQSVSSRGCGRGCAMCHLLCQQCSYLQPWGQWALTGVRTRWDGPQPTSRGLRAEPPAGGKAQGPPQGASLWCEAWAWPLHFVTLPSRHILPGEAKCRIANCVGSLLQKKNKRQTVMKIGRNKTAS